MAVLTVVAGTDSKWVELAQRPLRERVQIWCVAVSLLLLTGALLQALALGVDIKSLFWITAAQLLGVGLVFLVCRRQETRSTCSLFLGGSMLWLFVGWASLVCRTHAFLPFGFLLCAAQGITSLVLVCSFKIQTLLTVLAALVASALVKVSDPPDQQVLEMFGLITLGSAFGYTAVFMRRGELRKFSELMAFRRFVSSTLGHEVRSSAGAIAMRAELLREQMEDGDARESLDAIEAAALRILNVTENVCDLIQLEDGEYSQRPDRVDPNEVVKNAASELAATARVKKVNVEVSLDPDVPKVLTDKQHLRRVTANLIDNALRVAPKGGKIAVRTIFSDPWVKVSFGGKGLSFDNRVTTCLAEGGKRFLNESSGTTLGLVVAKQIVESMGGKLDLEKSTDGETNIAVYLPRGKDWDAEGSKRGM